MQGLSARQQRAGEAGQGLGVRAVRLLLSDRGRPIRFALIGASAAAIQLALLALLTRHGWQQDLADALAFLLAAQVNFACNNLFTWRGRGRDRPLWRRWLLFHGSILGTAALNLLVFDLARRAIPVLPASALGIAVAAVGNFLIGDRLVFAEAHLPMQRVEDPAA